MGSKGIKKRVYMGEIRYICSLLTSIYSLCQYRRIESSYSILSIQIRGGESSKWLVKQLKAFKVGVEDSSKGKEKEVEKKKEKVEPTMLEDGTKVWPKVERRKVSITPNVF